jgi:transcription-repair coupling factor (superfamily II helicase)
MTERLDPIEAGLRRANARIEDFRAALDAQREAHAAGLPPCALAYALADALRSPRTPPVLVVTPTTEGAQRLSSDLRFFLGRDLERQVLAFPAPDTSPFLDVAPDRRAAMDRLVTLSHLAQGLPVRAVVASVAALLRRVPPHETIRQKSLLVEKLSEIDRDELVDVLEQSGYLRVPIAEDPGTYAVRGGLVDVYPPHAEHPARIELDDDLVASIRSFDADDQRTLDELERLFIHPVREILLGAEETRLARDRLRALSDAANVPTRVTRKLLDDLESGRVFYGIEGLLPAFYPRLDSLLDFLDDDTRLVVVDPTGVAKHAVATREEASADRGAKVEAGEPAFPLDALFLGQDELLERIVERRPVVVHRIATLGEAHDEESPLATLDRAPEEGLMHLGAEDHAALVAELKSRRGTGGRDDALAPVAERAARWLDVGLRVFFTARSHAQAERLIRLLRGYEIPVEGKPIPFTPDLLRSARKVRAQVVVGDLGDGALLPTEGLVFVTEEEVFGTRTHKRQKGKDRSRARAEAFLEDLRELSPGDFVVHADHGVGRYLGLERKALSLSKSERYFGVEAPTFEVLVVEYAGGDKLYLPVTRLHQIQKFAGSEGHVPKLDRLGGSTFAKKKATVERAVRQMAEELLKLYAERAAAKRASLPPAERLYAEFEATFPFDETPDQQRAIEDVLEDLSGDQPMDRLICGDVGFGKTEVALRAAFRVASAGRQVAVLCPTTVLAQQHSLTFRNRFSDYPIVVKSLSRFVDKKDQAKTLAGLKDGTVDVVIGTHRLLSKDVHFKDLGLLVVDEEQRFGVTHKERIKKLRTSVDVLTLSATPIPRTLHLALGGLRDLSLIATAPTDRRAVRTFACRWDDHTIREAVRRELRRGGQVFFVYNRIEGLYERAQRLQDLVPEARIAVAHGQMKEDLLERTMTDFIDGEYDVLCSTAIIESGLDIPRANTMIVDRADTFGLSQLYQLRGRVGRSRERAYCYLVTPPPSTLTDDARARIEALERFTQLGSGFHVASLDMELRGAGDMLGAEQSGNVSLVGFDLFVHMLEEAVAQLQGEPLLEEFDPELTLDFEHYLPDDYVEDVGLRLSLYKRFSRAEDDFAIEELARELEDRFGPPPPPARSFIRAMSLKPPLRELRAHGVELVGDRMTLHLREDTPLDPAQVMRLVSKPGSGYKLTPDLRLTRRFGENDPRDSVDRALAALDELLSMRKHEDES